MSPTGRIVQPIPVAGAGRRGGAYLPCLQVRRAAYLHRARTFPYTETRS